MTAATKGSSMSEPVLQTLKGALRTIIGDENWIPDEESYRLFHQIVPWPATEVCIVNDRGELLLEYRDFAGWPGEFGKIKDWYIPGGYMFPEMTLEECCKKHIAKDGIIAKIELIDTAGVLKWAPGEHPFAFPVSVVCVCRLLEGISFKPGKEGNFKFFDTVVPTAVPNHTKLQEWFFAWRDQNMARFTR